ncbi:Mad3/BUB1 homology region 1-domain-containing protein [Xylariaceae sp. FL0594]|nr:Mad3/BUB1 homology region 1-domain-containing protein [Xylariaceae sp. FL0594]
MAAGDLIDFDVIEGQKENIQSLPGGRSAKKLAEVFTPSPLHKLSTPTPADTKNINDCIRAEYEAEVAALSESDDPLDVFDRYVRWTFDAYPSAQATPQSQLHTLLERATKAFIGSAQYKNDPRYLKLWLHYIRFFSDSPRETFVFLSRHGIGESLALFYEEYAAWLESAGRWNQAEEVYKLGIERDARPVQRLIRKFGEFEKRRAHREDAAEEPSSPALPSVRPALVAKIDPFAAAAAPADPQAARPNMGVGGASSRPAKPKSSKLTIFSDAASSEQPAMPPAGEGAKGWDTIGSLASRKKENAMEPKPWAGETLATSVKKKSNGPKMAVFRDPSLARIAESHIVIAPSTHQVIINPLNGKRERIHVNLEAVYPTPEEPGTELSFEELWAANRGWLDLNWDEEDDDNMDEQHDQQQHDENARPIEALNRAVEQKLVIHRDLGALDENGADKSFSSSPKPAKGRKKKVMEVNETQIIKANLDSPSGPKIKKKRAQASEPTMTMHTRAATDDIYDIFNAPIKPSKADDESDEDEYMSDGDYTSGAESTGHTQQIEASELDEDDGEEVVDEEEEEEDDEDVPDDKSVNSEWSDFTAQKHIPRVEDESDREVDGDGDSDMSDLIDTNELQDVDEGEGVTEHAAAGDDFLPTPDSSPPKTLTRFIPIPPEDYEPPTRPYRDPAEVANNRLPFMTPITERTETSLGMNTEVSKAHYYKTPSKTTNNRLSTTTEEEDGDEDEDFEPLSSPLREISSGSLSPVKLPQALPSKPKTTVTATAVHKGPIIKDLLCNPVDAAIREEILEKIHPPLSSYPGFYDHRNERSDRGAEIRKFAKSLSKSARGSTDKTGPVTNNNNNNNGSNNNPAVVLEFPELMCEYTLKRELGAGAFAPVYLVENSAPEEEGRASVEALKMENPPSAWEFYIMRLAAERLSQNQDENDNKQRALASIAPAHELHLYRDECFLVIPFYPHRTLLSVVNWFREQQPSSSGTMDEVLAMFFTIEILRTVEALHGEGILHGDLKADNCMLRLDDISSHAPLSSQWRADGSGGWSARGVALIDFGRGIDMRCFDEEKGAQFIADWKTTTTDCAEMREGRPWTYQIDYFGLAGIVHCLLFGRYIDTTTTTTATRGDYQGGLGGGKRYKIKENLKRYWQVDIWAELFDVLLNPGLYGEQQGVVRAGGGGIKPVTKKLRETRRGMEDWLGKNCEKGIGLRANMARVENWARSMAGSGARKG